MSDNLDAALGIGGGTATPSQPAARTAAPTLIRIRKGDTVSGPYSVRQVRAMWDTGGLTADAEYAADGADWKPLLELMEGSGNTGAGVGTGASPAGVAIAALAVQQKLKSTTAAVLLGIFLPFFGSFYGSPFAAIVPLVVGVPVSFVLTMAIAQSKGGMTDAVGFTYVFAFSGAFAIWSLFWSLSAVKHHNAAVLAEAQKNPNCDKL